jgi:DNA-binding transcriptional LysR family regulator
MNNGDVQYWYWRLWRRAVNLDIDCLRSFLMVADAMSFSRAAETVGRSQSTISQQIAKLETQVGRPLLSRRKGRVLELTSEGDRLVQYARRILQLNDEACASMSDDALAGFVRLGVPLDFFGRDFTIWLARFKAKHPMVGLEVEANQSETLQKRGAARAVGVGQRTKLRRRRSGIDTVGAVSAGLHLSPVRNRVPERLSAFLASEFCQSKLRMPEGGGRRRHGHNGSCASLGCRAASDRAPREPPA